MNLDNIKKLLSNHDREKVKVYLGYILSLYNATNKDKTLVSKWWMDQKSDDYFASVFSVVEKDGLEFDGVNITLQNNGVSYNVVAYKNKMMLVYPESLFDVQLVKEGDKFKFSKENGKVTYQHEIGNPFGDAEIIGAYCIIKNKRGQFLTLLSRSEIDRHRQIAKQDFIWNNWFGEMCLKTIVKKACKQHFNDVFSTMDTLDNEQNDLGLPLDVSLETKQAIEAIKTKDELMTFYKENKDKNAGTLEGFTLLCTKRKESILADIKSEPVESNKTTNESETVT